MFKNIVRIFLVVILTFLLGYTLQNKQDSKLEKETTINSEELIVDTQAKKSLFID